MSILRHPFKIPLHRSKINDTFTTLVFSVTETRKLIQIENENTKLFLYRARQKI